MVTITIRPGRAAFTGHADFAPPGQDVVCAAVSALYETLRRTGGVTETGQTLRWQGGEAETVAAAVARTAAALAAAYPGHVSLG